MPGVPTVLLDQVAQQPPQAGIAAVRAEGVDELADPAIGQGGAEPGTGPFDRAVHSAYNCSGVSSAAELNSQSLLPSQPVASHGVLIGCPRGLVVTV